MICRQSCLDLVIYLRFRIDNMKQIEVVVAHERLADVNAILYKHNVGGMMFYDIKGRGRVKREATVVTDVYNYGKKYAPEFGSRTKIDVLVADPLAKQLVQDLVKNLSTGSASDGKIFVKDISEAYDIGSREFGDDALK
jgi:nitrogen regulatory protein P-II 1